MKPMQFDSKWVLITGASSGLGKQMAHVFARDHKANLVLAARRADRLKELADTLSAEHKVQVKIVPADLTREDEAVKVFDAATREVPLYAAVLNAGVTHFGHHDELSWEAFRQMLHLNVVSTSRLSTLLLPYLEQRREHGGLMLVSSMAGLSPVPYQAAYAGTKAFIANLGASLHHEMWPRGVSVTTFAPGGIQTEMTEGERFNELRGWLMPVDKCAVSGIASFKNRDYIAVPGFVYRVGSYLQKLVPQKFFMEQVAARYRKSLAANGAQPQTPSRANGQ
jgi:uncharacterized protein